MKVFLFIFAIGAATGHPSSCNRNSDENEIHTYDFPFISRSHWRARPPKQVHPLHTQVPYVVVHHSCMLGGCHSTEICSNAMRSMQDFHMNGHGLGDIGYSFAVANDGTAYEGRGWKTLGARPMSLNSDSIGICVIGDSSANVPSPEQMKTTKALIASGVDRGYITPDYKLVESASGNLGPPVFL